MRFKIICIRDIVADVYAQPQFAVNTGGAIRAFGDQCKDKNPQNIVGQHPEDFELYELGEYDDGEAKFIIEGKPKQIAIGKNYKD